MASLPCLLRLQAAVGVLAACFAAQQGVAGTNPGGVDLSDLRIALRAVETDVLSGLDAPADVAGIWAKLPLAEQGPTGTSVPATAPAATSVFDNSFIGTAGAIAPFAILTPVASTADAGGGSFSLQLSRTMPAIIDIW